MSRSPPTLAAATHEKTPLPLTLIFSNARSSPYIKCLKRFHLLSSLMTFFFFFYFARHSLLPFLGCGVQESFLCLLSPFAEGSLNPTPPLSFHLGLLSCSSPPPMSPLAVFSLWHTSFEDRLISSLWPVNVPFFFAGI